MPTGFYRRRLTANRSLRQLIVAFSPQSVLNLRGLNSFASFASDGRQLHIPGSIPIPSEYQLASHVYLNEAPGLIISVSMVMGLPAQATDRSSAQLSLMGDLSEFLKVQTVGLLQQRPAANTCQDRADKVAPQMNLVIILIVRIPKPQGLRPR